MLDDGLESPRRPLQRLPHHSPKVPSPSDSGLRFRDDLLTGSPVRQGSLSPSRQPIPPFTTGSSGVHSTNAADVTFVQHRLVALEGRFGKLESMLVRCVAKVDSLASQWEADKRERDALRLRFDTLDEQHVSVLKSTRDFGSRLLQQEQRFATTTELTQRADASKTRTDALEARVDELSRGVKRSIEHTDQQASNIRAQLSQATRLLQNYIKRHCDALSDESAARLVAFEKDRAELVQQLAEATQELHATRLSLAECKASVSKQESAIHRQEEAARHVSEEVRILQRRFMSALRHLSHDASSFLGGPTATEPHDAAKSLFEDRVSTGRSAEADGGSPYSGVAPSKLRRNGPVVADAELAATPPSSNLMTANRHDDESIDQFLAELNFMSRHAVM